MKDGKMLILTVGVIVLFAGSAMAAELIVTIQGTGDGIVYGEGIDCGEGGEDCTETYPDETILHLKAYPDEYSTFEGWLVDGEPQEGTLIIRKNITVTAIFDKKGPPAKEFEIVGTRPSEFVYLDMDNLFWPLYNTRGEIVGALQPTGSEGDYQWNVIIPDEATLTIPAITSVVLPTQVDHVVAYGEVFVDPVVEGENADLSIYTLDGSLLKFVKTNINSPFWVADVSHNGDFWVAGGGYTKDDPFVIRRYAPDGTLLWGQLLPDHTYPSVLAVSLDNRYAVLGLGSFTESNLTQLYDEQGTLIYESSTIWGVGEFVSDRTVIMYGHDEWRLCRVEDLETPFASGKAPGNLASIHPVPGEEYFLIRASVSNSATTTVYFQAVHQETGWVLAERSFEVPSDGWWQKLIFYRFTDHDSFEVLINGDTIVELRMPE